VSFETYGLFVGLALCLFVVDSAGKRHLGSGQVLIACLVAIAAMTLVPLDGPEKLELRPATANAVGDLANLLLFAPLGGVFYLRNWTATRAIATAAAIAITIELLQRVVPGRTTSVDDVIFNTLGVTVGWLVARQLSSRLRS
jgi:glycopeptide antibiotics resistance protein